MFIGGYKRIDDAKVPLILDSMKPVDLNPDARYLIAAAGYPDNLVNETRFRLPVTELLDADGIALAAAATEQGPTTHAAPAAGSIDSGGDQREPEKASMAESPNWQRPLAAGDVMGVLNTGFVELMDVMGTDDDIAEAARTSYTGGKKARANEGLIRYLYRHQHTTPFEMAELKFRLYIPIFVYRQLFRHRTASQLEPEIAECITNDTAFQTFSVQNEMSGRYVDMPEHCFVPELPTLQKQSADNKQGRADGQFTEEEQYALRDKMGAEIATTRQWYHKSLESGLAKELSRVNLPLAQYTCLVWKINLKNLLHFLALRLHPHAQYEVREYARAMYAVVQSTFPITALAFDDYVLSAERFTRHELAALRGTVCEADRRAVYESFAERVGNKRERAEFAAKLGLK